MSSAKVRTVLHSIEDEKVLPKVPDPLHLVYLISTLVQLLCSWAFARPLIAQPRGGTANGSHSHVLQRTNFSCILAICSQVLTDHRSNPSAIPLL